MARIRVNSDILKSNASIIVTTSSGIQSTGYIAQLAASTAPSYDGQFGPKVQSIGEEATSIANKLSISLRNQAGSLENRARAFDQADTAMMIGAGIGGSLLPIQGLKNNLGLLSWLQLLILKLLFHRISGNSVPIAPSSGIDNSISGFNLRFQGSPVPMDKVTSTNWYGNTEFAYNNKKSYYSQLQGLHSGLDYMCPTGTPITNTLNKTGKIISLDNKQYSYSAGPKNILVDYGDKLVLYGHTSDSVGHNIGDVINPGEKIGETGTDGITPHLHMEVIIKDPGWEKLSAEQQINQRPGSIRTNPVPYLEPGVIDQMKSKIWDKFHPTIDGKWSNPQNQPDIIPGGEILVK